MKSYLDYVDEACKAIDRWSGTTGTGAPTQLQTINLALLMATCDLIKALEKK